MNTRDNSEMRNLTADEIKWVAGGSPLLVIAAIDCVLVGALFGIAVEDNSGPLHDMACSQMGVGC